MHVSTTYTPTCKILKRTLLHTQFPFHRTTTKHIINFHPHIIIIITFPIFYIPTSLSSQYQHIFPTPVHIPEHGQSFDPSPNPNSDVLVENNAAYACANLQPFFPHQLITPSLLCANLTSPHIITYPFNSQTITGSLSHSFTSL